MALSDLPQAWWHNLATHANYESLLTLSRTCHGVRDCVMDHWKFHHVQLDCDPRTIEQSASTLALALEQSDRMALRLEAREPRNIHHSAAAVAIMCRVVTSARADLAGVRAVNLCNLTLDSMVPAWLILACINMKELHLSNCQFANPPAALIVLPQCPQLERLVISTSTVGESPNIPAIVEQSQALPSLKSLSIDFNNSIITVPMLEQLAAIGAQITELRLVRPPPFNMQQLQQLVTCFPCLHALELPTCDMGDEELDLLLALPTLRHVACNELQLEEDHSHQQCVWTKLSMRVITMPFLARLPLECIQALRFCADEFSAITPSPDLEFTQRIATSFKVTGHLDTMIVYCTGLSDEHVIAVLPLVRGFSHVELYECDVTLSLLTELLVHMGHGSALTFNGCWFAPSLWPVLLPTLHELSGVSFQLEDITESQVLEACVGAIGPIRVEVYGWPDCEGIKDRVQAAMAAAGHQHVTLVTYDYFPPF